VPTLRALVQAGRASRDGAAGELAEVEVIPLGELLSVDQSEELGESILGGEPIEVGDTGRGLCIGALDVANGGMFGTGLVAHLIEGCLAWAECAVEEEIAREKYVLIIGKVVHLEADDRFFSDADGMDYEKAMPLCSMGGPNGMQFVRPLSTGKGDKYASMLSEPKK